MISYIVYQNPLMQSINLFIVFENKLPRRSGFLNRKTENLLRLHREIEKET